MGTIGEEPSSALATLEQAVVARPVDSAVAEGKTPAALLSAISLLGAAAPSLETAIRSAAQNGSALTVAFPKAIQKGLSDGTLRLLDTSTGHMATAVDASGQFVSHARVVGGATGQMSANAVTAGLAAAALPVAIAMAASYVQQRQLEKALASISAAVERVEVRMKDTDNGICDAGEYFAGLLQHALMDGDLSPYMRIELAMHRTAIEALFMSRRRYTARFKAELERQQIEREKSKGASHAWVEFVEDSAKSGELEEELVLFVRALVCRTKLAVATAGVIASESHGLAAMSLMELTERELREEFLDLYRRLRALAVHAPELNRIQRLPGFGRSIQQAHATVKQLVEELDQHVLPSIPDPDSDEPVVVTISNNELATVIQLFPAKVA